MLNKMYTPHINKLDRAEIIATRLAEILKDNEAFLKLQNKKATQDSFATIDSDFDFIIRYLLEYSTNNKDEFQKELKPKGTVLIILSYNEPFVVSVIPILNALIAGNKVVVKPSVKCVDFFKKIWSDEKLPDDVTSSITIIEKPSESEIKSEISMVDCVYFFGSLENAKKIYQMCAESFVEFVPEIETADCKIFKFENPSDEFLSQDCESTLVQSFTHAGQTCQRISGIFVHESNFEAYKEKLTHIFESFIDMIMEDVVPKDFVVNKIYEEKILADIYSSNPQLVIKSDVALPKIVVEPVPSSKLVQNGYFYPVLWLKSFNDSEQLCYELNTRKFFLGVNIQSDDQGTIKDILDRTKFTRFTINTTHVDVGLNEGWGGRWPSGSGGYKSWIEHFSVPFTIIR